MVDLSSSQTVSLSEGTAISMVMNGKIHDFEWWIFPVRKLFIFRGIPPTSYLLNYIKHTHYVSSVRPIAVPPSSGQETPGLRRSAGPISQLQRWAVAAPKAPR